MAAMATISAVSAGVTAVQANNRAKDQAKAADDARRELNQYKDRFEAIDTSNPYLNMENVYEDVTINQQAAEFERSQALQSQANVMNQMRTAAGTSGIAALAQTLSDQGALAAQKTSASIAQQELNNQAAERGEAARLQGLEREGELISRQAEFGKIQSLMGLSAGDLNVASQAEQLALTQRDQAIAQGIQASGQAAAGYAGGAGQASTNYNVKNNLSPGDEGYRDPSKGLRLDAQEYAAVSGNIGGVGGGTDQQYALFEQWLASQKGNY